MPPLGALIWVNSISPTFNVKEPSFPKWLGLKENVWGRKERMEFWKKRKNKLRNPGEPKEVNSSQFLPKKFS